MMALTLSQRKSAKEYRILKIIIIIIIIIIIRNMNM